MDINGTQVDVEDLYGVLTAITIAFTMIALEGLMEIPILQLQIMIILKFGIKDLEIINFIKKIFCELA